MQQRSSQRSALKIEWRGSPRLALMLGMAHALSIAAAAMAIAPWWHCALCIAALLASAVYYLRRALAPATPFVFSQALAPHRIAALELKDDGAGAARTLDGQWHEAQLTPMFAAPLFTIIRAKLEGRRLAKFVVLMPDMLSPEDYRRLLVHLRWR